MSNLFNVALKDVFKGDYKDININGERLHYLRFAVEAGIVAQPEND